MGRAHDAAFMVKVALESGMLAPTRPDKLARMAATYVRWGKNPATAAAIAAFRHPDDIYLVDEVTAVGDKAFQEKCRRAFLERQERSSVIIVSHNLATIRSYCKRCAVLQGGKLELFDSIKEAAQVYEAKGAA